MNPVPEILIDAFDVDMQLYMGRVLQTLRKSPTGERFAGWATQNPAAFEALLRGISVAAQRLPRDKAILTDTVRDLLSRLPVEIRRTILDDNQRDRSQMSDDPLRDPEFRREYAEAIEDLSEADLNYVAGLIPGKLKEWVLSPLKIRPHLLKKWREEKTTFEVINEAAAKAIPVIEPKIEEFRASIKDFTAKLEERQELRKKKRKHWIF